MATRPAARSKASNGRLAVKRAAVALLAALSVAGTAGAYVPASSSSQALGEPQGSAPEPDSARDFDRMLTRLDRQEHELEQELTQIGPKLEIVQKRMVARGRQYYRLVRAGMLPVGGGFDALVDHATRVERVRATLARNIANERELRERQAAARKELRQVRAERAPLLVRREAMKHAQQALQEADERRDAFQRAFGSSTDPPHTAVYGADTGPIEADPNSRFAAMKGRLSFPLAGRAEVSDDSRAEAGLKLRASRDTAVRAVYPGTVTFAGETEHGLTVVVDHGDHYFTTYGQLQRLDVKVHDAVPERGRIGWALRRGSKRPSLFFELRHGNSVLDAAAWLGL